MDDLEDLLRKNQHTNLGVLAREIHALSTRLTAAEGRYMAAIDDVKAMISSLNASIDHITSEVAGIVAKLQDAKGGIAASDVQALKDAISAMQAKADAIPFA